jgi:hypothetical protein
MVRVLFFPRAYLIWREQTPAKKNKCKTKDRALAL